MENIAEIPSFLSVQNKSSHSGIAISRFYALDALRCFVVIAGVIFHISLFYSNLCPPYWPTNHLYHYTIFDYCTLGLHTFRMEVFFLLSGFFANILYEKNGLPYFIKNRILRIFLPFLISWPLVCTMFLFVRFKTPVPISNNQLPIFHLWYLYYLLIFYAINIPILYGIKLINIKFALRNDYFSKFLKSPYHIIVLACLTCPMLFFMHKTVVDTAESFNPVLRLLLYYNVFFTFGWLMRQSSLSILAKNRWLYLSIAIPNFIFLFFNLLNREIFAPPISFQLSLIRISYAICSWASALFLVGFFQHSFDKKNIIIRYLVDSSYWIYIIHLPIVFLLQTHLIDSNLSGWMQFFTVTSLTFTISLITYQLFVRSTWIGNILNGPSRVTIPYTTQGIRFSDSY